MKSDPDPERSPTALRCPSAAAGTAHGVLYEAKVTDKSP